MLSRKRHLALRLVLPASLLIVSACAGQESVRPLFPSRADLLVEDKPIPSASIVTDDTANALHNSAIESWGERGWDAVARICRWAASNGLPITCPAPKKKEQ